MNNRKKKILGMVVAGTILLTPTAYATPATSTNDPKQDSTENDVNARLEEAKQKVIKAKEKLKETKSDLSDAETKKEEANNKVKQAEKDVEKAKAKVEEAQSKAQSTDKDKVEAARQTLQKAEAAKKEAEKVKEEAYNKSVKPAEEKVKETEKKLEEATSADNLAKANLEGIQKDFAALNGAEKRLETAKENLKKAKDSLDAKTAEVAKIQKLLDTSKDNYNEYLNELNELKEKEANAKEEATNAPSMLKQGSIAYFKDKVKRNPNNESAKRAVKILTDKEFNSTSSDINPGDEDDTTSLKNMKKALERIKQGNDLRTSSENSIKNLPPLLVADDQMAQAQANVAWTKKTIRTSGQANYASKEKAENLSWGSGDPYTNPNNSWYTSEKAEYDADPNRKKPSLYKHYLNLMNSKFYSTGFACTSAWNAVQGGVNGQVFGDSKENAVSVEDYIKDLETYVNRLNNASDTHKKIKQQLDDLAPKEADYKKEIAALEETLKKAQKEAEKLQREAENAHQNVQNEERLVNDKDRIEKLYNDALSTAKKTSQEKLDAEKSIERAKLELETAKTETAEAEKNVKEKTAEVERARKDLETLEKPEKDLQQAISALSDANTRLERSKQSVQLAQEHVNNATSEYKKAEENLRNAEEDLRVAKENARPGSPIDVKTEVKGKDVHVKWLPSAKKTPVSEYIVALTKKTNGERSNDPSTLRTKVDGNTLSTVFRNVPDGYYVASVVSANGDLYSAAGMSSVVPVGAPVETNKPSDKGNVAGNSTGKNTTQGKKVVVRKVPSLAATGSDIVGLSLLTASLLVGGGVALVSRRNKTNNEL
ncbi:hypothetical protein HCQ94_05095 [Actinomyces sp. zg-332]|uniref:hypothetical protein n=1 Tax=Actinomyces sp. zg-332 TaxID=2708340 RepID=UPI001422DABC|nr:hypothetical protein [Actinomyces sp. zg-332]QPK93950.1 hypothetical protein HCQ94_05095 [Actinomyces sp. zg-332]